MLIGRQISHAFAGREVLRNIDISIPPGSITGLLGPSGSGKSTLIKFLGGLETPQFGSVRYPGSDENPRSVAVVFQKLALWPHMNLVENIFFAVRHTIDRRKLRRCAELVKRLKLQKVLKQYPSQCSLGEQQRAALIRALIAEPAYLLLDEPTSALDFDSSTVVESLLKEERDKKTGILLVTHDRLLLNRLSDKRFLLSDGQIAAIHIDRTPATHSVAATQAY